MTFECKLCIKKSRLGWKFEEQTASERTMRAYDRNLSVLPCLRLMRGMTVISKNARNGEIGYKIHKDTPEVSQFYSFY